MTIINEDVGEEINEDGGGAGAGAGTGAWDVDARSSPRPISNLSPVVNIVVLGDLRIERSNDSFNDAYNDFLKEGSGSKSKEPESLVDTFLNKT